MKFDRQQRQRVCYTPMRTLLLLTALLLSLHVQAEPVGTNDEMNQLLVNKGLLAQMNEVRQTASDKAAELVVTAMGFLGVPYRRGGNSAESGFDCSGFVKSMFEQTAGLILPRRAEQQAASTQKISRTDLQPGDLVFFNTLRRAFSHVGIYIGDGKFIHSPRSGSEVKVENMAQRYWSRRFDGARRVPMAATNDAAN